MRRMISRAVLAIPVVALVVFVGCGEGDETTSAGGIATTTPTAAPTTLPATTSVATTPAARCSNVAFSANTEDVASDIRSTGLACTEAEALVRKVGAQMSTSTGPTRVETDGFACLRTSLRSGDHGAPLGTIECTNAATKVSFVRSFVS